MTRSEIEQAVYRYLNKATASPDTTTQTRIRGFVNDRLRAVLSLSGMERLRHDVITFASVADQESYGLPLSVAKIEQMVDRSNYYRLTEHTLDWLRTAWPNPTQTASTPTGFVFTGYQPVQLPPSNASELFLKSTSASDVQVAYVEGYITGGLPRSASVTLTGTTAVSVSASITTWVTVTKLYLASAAVGTVSLYEDSDAGTVLAQIPIGGTASQYQRLILWPTPSSARTYTIDYQRTLTDLAQNTDTPPIPVDFHDLLVDGACADECLKLDDDRYQYFEARYQATVTRLKAWLWSDASRRLVPGGGPSRISNLGGMYPADWHGPA